MTDNHELLHMEGISKAFPGAQALDNVHLNVARGEIHALVGENGAGKSTLMKILTGALKRDTGRIIFNGKPVDIKNPSDAQSLGISIIHQELTLIPYLTVGQNIFLGREPRRERVRLIDWKLLYRQAQQILDRLNLQVDARAEVQGLSIAQQQMVEVAKALSLNADLIAMDEPTSTLTDQETQILFVVMRALKKQGVSLIFISHRLEEVFKIADQVTVLRDGEFVGTNPVSELNQDIVIRMMVGRELEEVNHKETYQKDDVILEVGNLQDGRELHGVSLKLHRGEILGIAGLVGAGRTALAETIFGVRSCTEGEIRVNGKPIRIKSPIDAIRCGMGFVPEDRKQQGLFMNMAVRENIVISSMDEITNLGFVNFTQASQVADKLVRRLDIRTPSLLQRVHNLSGGNQQKIIIARWLILNLRILILDEPTRGIDVGAKAEIHNLTRQLAERGVGILMISSELPEVLLVSDRILVMREGRLVSEFTRHHATQDNIMRAATGGLVNNAE